MCICLAQALLQVNGGGTCSYPSFTKAYLQPSLDEVIYTLHTCRKKKDSQQALYLHLYISNLGLETHKVVGNNLVSTMVEVGCTLDAQHLFDRLPYRSERATTSLLTGYVQSGKPEHALTLYSRLQNSTSLHPTGHTFVALIKACSKLKDLDRVLSIHAEIMRIGSADKDPFVGSALVDLYAKCGLLNTAQEVLNQLSVRDVVSWTALIAGYADYGLYEEALECLKEMQGEGVSANMTTYICCLKACRTGGTPSKGLEIHAEVERKGLLCKDVVLGTAVVDMYCKHGLLSNAQEVFDNLRVRNTVSWTTLIGGYAEHGCSEEALACYDRMLADGIPADNVAFLCGLQACGNAEDGGKAQDIHAEVVRRGLLEKDSIIGNSLIDTYVRCGFLSKAQEVFDKLQVRSVVTWTSLLVGYAEQSRADYVLKFLEGMALEGVVADAVALVCSMQACGTLGATSIGRELHVEIERKSLLEGDLVIGNTLVDMYAKCGSISRAHEVFDKLPMRDVVSWTALIAGYAQLGESEYVCHIFEKMVENAVRPDPVTFIVVLDACGHEGLCDKSEMYYEAMSKRYGILPTLAHHTGMVELFCCAGRLQEASTLIQKIPSIPNSSMWHIVLDTSRKWGNVGLGVEAFEHALHFNEKDAEAYVLMSRLLTEVGEMQC